jgi:hypothetical protein
LHAQLRQDFFQLVAQFVRLKNEAGILGAALHQFLLPAAPVVPGSTIRAADFRRRRTVMRSDLVFGALSHVSNRYQLCQLASKATRKLHKPNTRLQDTTNEVLVRFQFKNPGSVAAVKASVEQPQPVERRRAA